MISVSAWKRAALRPTPRPANGPASQLGQPPLRAGTYCDGPLAAPAATSRTLVNTPSRPSAPSQRSARVQDGDSPEPALLRPPADSRAVRRRPVRGVVACTRSLLRLEDLRGFRVPSTL